MGVELALREEMRAQGPGVGGEAFAAHEPGRSLITITRSDRKIASGMLCVISSTVFFEADQMRCSSRFICSRVIASSAPNGSSISRRRGS